MRGIRQDQRKVILISGASSGIGQATAIHLAERGHRVFGTTRNLALRPKIAGVEWIEMDLTDDDSISRCARAVVEKAPRIDVLINNAGRALIGFLEETDASEIHEQLKINFLGTVGLTQAILPVMHSQGSGLILTVSSLAGQIALPGMGAYSAAKFALEGYFQALRLEQEYLESGIRVAMIEPGFVRTGLVQNGCMVSDPLEKYSEPRDRLIQTLKNHINRATQPETIAKAIGKLIENGSPALQNPVGFDSKLINRLRRFLPASMMHRLWKKEFHLS